MDINSRIESLRKVMKEKNIDAYIIPSSDSHQSEYTGDHFKSRQWISGFTGSAGTVLVTSDNAILWTDGRYFLQAEEELKTSQVELFKMGQKDVPSITEYLKENLQESQSVGFDGKVFSYKEVRAMKRAFKAKNIKLEIQNDLIDEIWKDRPELPRGRVFIHEEKYSGKNVEEKLKDIRKAMKKKNADYYLISSLDDIAWTFNIRGNDISYNPVIISYALIDLEKAILFIEGEKLDVNVRAYFRDNDIEVKAYDSIKESLQNLEDGKSIYLDLNKTSIWSYENLPRELRKINGQDIAEGLKAIKNDIEIKNFKNAQTRDGVAMVKFLHWLDENVKKGGQTEISASDKLEEFRSQGANYVSLSFETIASYKDHAAIVHYSVTKETDYKLKDKGMILIDSGGQYLDGTTDITRTIVLGDISDEEKTDFTLVLKGHIALDSAKFLYGTTGTHLDVLARKALWDHGKDYTHGTGHGIGYLLNVHEGPQGISPVWNKTKLEAGMLITNEPGFYKKDSHGIRTENILLVKESEETEYGRFMEFETTTFCPIDLRAIDKRLLVEEEIKWINSYHKEVYHTLSPHLDDDLCEWLRIRTKDI